MATVKEIFSANQVLTLAVAKTLIGKTISVTNSEDRSNSCWVRTGKVLSIESEWDLAAKKECDDKYSTMQEYWKSFMSESQISDRKNRLRVVADSEIYAVCEIKNYYFDKPTFFGSDADREIYFVIED